MTVSRYPLIDGSTKCLDPGFLYSDRSAAPQDFWGRANSITCPTGQEPGVAYLVVPRSVNDTLDMNTLHSITWVDEAYNDLGILVSQTLTTFQNYVITRIWMVGVDGDGKSAALVELRDKRHLMMGVNNWEYNVRRHGGGGNWSAGTPEDHFYTDTLNSGSLYTWQQVLNDLWLSFPSTLRGTTPTLPYIPVQKPENLKYHGDAWLFVGDLLARCQSRLVYDPVADAFTVVRIGQAQSGLAAQVAALANRVTWDATPRQNLQLSSIAETIRFYFPKYGIPNQTDAGGQTVKPYYTIEKPSNLRGAQAGSKMPYITDFQAVYNNQAEADKSNAAPANDSELQALATELARKIGDKIDLGGERGRIIYSGIVPPSSTGASAKVISLGSEVAEMCWRDYGGDEGCVTDVRTAEELPDGQGEGIDWQPRDGSWIGKTAGIAKGSTGTFTVWDKSSGTWQATSETFTVTALGALIPANKYATAWDYRGQKVAAPWECQ